MAEHFDAIVIGDGLAGLLAAALLARRKRRVRVMPAPPARAPAVEPPLFGLRTAPCLQRVLEDLGLVHTLRTRLDGEPRPITLALPDRRFTLPADLAGRSRILAEVFPEARPELLQLFDRIEGFGASLEPLLDGSLALPPEGFGPRRAWRRSIQGLPAAQLIEGAPPWAESPPVRALVAALLAVAGRFEDPARPMSAGGSRALWHLVHGIAPVRGGRAGLAAMIREKLETYGGGYDRDRPVTALEIRSRRVAAVLGRGDQRYTAELVLTTVDDARFARLLGHDPEPAPGDARQVRVELPAADRPADLADPCGWVAQPDAPACLVRVNGEGLDVRWVGDAPLPPLDRLVPFARTRAGVPVAAARPAPGDLDPLGLYRRPVRGPLRNLLRVGEWVMPGLGLEGEAITAWQAVHVAEKLLPRRSKVLAR